MKSSFFFFLSFFSIIMLSFINRQTKYLPVYIGIADTILFRNEILLSLKGAFNARKITVINKNETEAYIKNEASILTQDFYRQGGDLGDFEKIKSYMSSNMRKVANSLEINLRVNPDGVINDTIIWTIHSVPIDFLNPPKFDKHFIILDSNNSNSLFQISQSVVDSVITSNTLVKE